ncbi:MAG: SDR family NAD(P)-dependent oxidoreductase [Pseudomonadota bacterium]
MSNSARSAESRGSGNNGGTGRGGRTALVIGATGGIGAALVEHWCADSAIDRVIAIRRDGAAEIHAPHDVWQLATDYSEAGIADCLAEVLESATHVVRVAVAIGTLHGADYQPEKSLDSLNEAALAEVYRVNCILPMLWVAALARALRRTPDSRIAVLSARVGSISDNRLGGWYGYRSAKAALNMGLRSAAIEVARRSPGIKLVAYHPGTVDTALSKPFQRNVPADKLFTPAFTAARLAALLDEHAPDGELSYLAWDGSVVPW